MLQNEHVGMSPNSKTEYGTYQSKINLKLNDDSKMNFIIIKQTQCESKAKKKSPQENCQLGDISTFVISQMIAPVD